MKKTAIALAMTILLALPLAGRGADFVEGAHYFTLTAQQPVETGDKIEVLELFWYGCPHCYLLEPYIHRWLGNKPDNAEYVALPAVFRKSWEIHARAWYTFEALGLVEQLHAKFFDAIHKDGKPMQDAEAVVDFAAANGAERASFREAMTSFSVESRLARAIRQVGRYGASGVPTIVVDGKYRATVASAGGHPALLALIDFLVEKAAAER